MITMIQLDRERRCEWSELRGIGCGRSLVNAGSLKAGIAILCAMVLPADGNVNSEGRSENKWAYCCRHVTARSRSTSPISSAPRRDRQCQDIVASDPASWKESSGTLQLFARANTSHDEHFRHSCANGSNTSRQENERGGLPCPPTHNCSAGLLCERHNRRKAAEDHALAIEGHGIALRAHARIALHQIFHL